MRTGVVLLEMRVVIKRLLTVGGFVFNGKGYTAKRLNAVHFPSICHI